MVKLYLECDEEGKEKFFDVKYSSVVKFFFFGWLGWLGIIAGTSIVLLVISYLIEMF